MTKNNGLERSPGFQFGQAYRGLVQLMQSRLKEEGITPEQWSVLYQTARTDGLMLKQAAELAGKDRPTTTRIVLQLERKGLLRKRPDPLDRRASLLSITDSGRSLIARTLPIERQLGDEVRSWMSEQEFELLLELLWRINGRLRGLAAFGAQSSEDADAMPDAGDEYESCGRRSCVFEG
ncbi:MarR family transcriptional regulator [Paenibacillus sp. IB182496]|uniref:MarR family transcriptional regulator n=1 Tax=Paenibacillus sabuli TaxID=2772509 RepID=A0A927GUP6_9BACL|nr:MarR family transcriptional regulator [Paenibacillus sabuli]MBD2848385.1 MarR family transcriptional regulator [Paenibacillus sabuli]